jgi:hypothetical protein
MDEAPSRPRVSQIQDLDDKRALLFSARLRFAPEAQSIRDAAIDGVVEQTLLLVDVDVGLTVPELQRQLRTEFGDNPVLSIGELRGQRRA